MKSLQNFLTAEVMAIARVKLKKYSNGVILQNSHVLILYCIADNKTTRIKDMGTVVVFIFLSLIFTVTQLFKVHPKGEPLIPNHR